MKDRMSSKNRIKLKLDETDRKIVSYLQENPAITHSKIAEHLELSQPAIGARIKKLTKRGIVAKQVGVNFQKLPELHLVRLNLKTTRPADVLELSEFCPFVINALKSTGDYNMTLFLASRNLKHLDSVIDRHYRSKSYVSNLQMDLVTSMNKPVIFPSLSISIPSAAGVLGNAGIVLISPRKATKNPAPLEGRISVMVIENFSGRP